MFEILIKAGSFISIILLGIILRKMNFFHADDFQVLSKIVLKITLTAAIINSFTGRELQYSMLLLTIISLIFGVILILLGIILYAKRGKDMQAFAVLNHAGCNIGNFVLPFAQSFLGPTGVMAVSLFDTGNAIICLGGAYSIASMVKNREKQFRVSFILKSLSKSVPLITYLVMMVLAVFHINLPKMVTQFTEIVGNANAFLAMLMIGVGFHLSGSREQMKDIIRILLVRYGLGITFALMGWFLLPFPLEYRQALVIAFLAPIASSAPAFTAELKSDYGLSAAVNSFSILISIVLITASLIIILR